MLVTEQATVTCLPPWLRTTPCWERRGAVCCEVLRSRRPRDREGPLSVRRAWPPHGAARGGLEPRHTPRTHTSTHRQRSRSLRWWRPAASTSPRGFRCDTSSSPSRPRCCHGCRQTCRPSTPSTTRTRQNQMCWAALVRAFGVDATAQPLQSRPRIGSHSRARGAEGWWPVRVARGQTQRGGCRDHALIFSAHPLLAFGALRRLVQAAVLPALAQLDRRAWAGWRQPVTDCTRC